MAEESRVRKVIGRVPGAHALSGGTDRLVAAQQQRLDGQQRMLDSHEISIQNLLVAMGNVEQHLPNVLNAIASHHGAQRQLKHNIDEVQADLQRQLDSFQEQFAGQQRQLGDLNLRFDDPDTGVSRGISALWERIEMVRRELLFEVRYTVSPDGANDPSTPSTSTDVIEPQIIDEEKVESMSVGGLRLNLGCGHIPLDGYVNVDMRDLPGVDVVAPVDRLPFEAGAVAEIFSAHMLEHFPVEQMRRQLLPYWVGLLRPGGVFRAVVPDTEAMVRRFEAGEMPFGQFREVLFGGQEYEGDFHFNMFTTDSLEELLRDAGLVEVEVEAQDRPNGLCFEFQISAIRPA